RTVLLRSSAEMPVVGPKRWSTETVNAVPIGRIVERDHRIKMQSASLLRRQWGAQDAAGVVDHERYLLGQRPRAGHDQIALVLAVGVVDHDHELTLCDRSDRAGDGIELDGIATHALKE
ncbi:MAG TPA: hypothetical protein VLE23_10585, partial [Geminicoccaceae bacterium]|nr:hypothetical protein [Geminicoccaceae bacterium]